MGIWNVFFVGRRIVLVFCADLYYLSMKSWVGDVFLPVMSGLLH